MAESKSSTVPGYKFAIFLRMKRRPCAKRHLPRRKLLPSLRNVGRNCYTIDRKNSGETRAITPATRPSRPFASTFSGSGRGMFRAANPAGAVEPPQREPALQVPASHRRNQRERRSARAGCAGHAERPRGRHAPSGTESFRLGPKIVPSKSCSNIRRGQVWRLARPAICCGSIKARSGERKLNPSDGSP